MTSLTALMVRLSLLIATATTALQAQTNPLISIKKYKVDTNKNLLPHYFSPIGLGSGLAFIEKTSNGNLLFYSMSDRGPNIVYKGDTLLVFQPQFSPVIAKIEVSEHEAKVKKYIPLKNNGKTITGLPGPEIETDEDFVDDHLHKIERTFGLDTEAITLDKKNNQVIIGDEYGPSLNVVDLKTGNIIKRFLPGNGLPEILKHREMNRGFESVSIDEHGIIYAVIEGILNLKDPQAKKALFTRIIALDPKTLKTKMFAYPFNKNYPDMKKAKVGDITSLGDNKFLIVEQGVIQDGNFSNLIYKIDLKNAIDITDKKLENGKELEFAKEGEIKEELLVPKELLVDMRAQGWKENKLEGLTFIDAKTIAITNDNDFGLDSYKIVNCQDPSLTTTCTKENPLTKTCEAAKKKLLCEKAMPIISKDAASHLWIINFEKNI